MVHHVALVQDHHVVEQLEDLGRRLQQRDDHRLAELLGDTALRGDDVEGGGAVEARADLVHHHDVLVAELHLARSHALTFSTRHTAGHGVADDGVLAVVESQLLDDDVRVVLEHGSGSI
ncbi:hypothetical protein PC116_g27657 [Phytophthora cactorum]|nr:hypothetical protein PC116_g27657 [Phytophthora cactorum]